MAVASIGSFAEGFIEDAGVLALLVLMTLEHLFPPIPSEVVLPFAGAQVAEDRLSLPGAIVASTAGSVAGASLLYAIARFGGRRLVLKLHPVLRVTDDDLERGEQRFDRHCRLWVVGGRLVPGLRSVVSFPAGLLEMRFWRYVSLTAIGSLLWNALLIGAGMALGESWKDIGGVVGPVGYVVLGVCLVAVAVWLVRKRSRPAAVSTS